MREKPEHLKNYENLRYLQRKINNVYFWLVLGRASKVNRMVHQKDRECERFKLLTNE